MPKHGKLSKQELFQDSCSEASRLVGGWLQRMSPDDKFFILKTEKVLGTNRAHDILAVEDKHGAIWIIDPTVWQFFPNRKDILICKAKNLNQAIQTIQKMYGCKWSISEVLFSLSLKNEQEYLGIIADNSSI